MFFPIVFLLKKIVKFQCVCTFGSKEATCWRVLSKLRKMTSFWLLLIKKYGDTNIERIASAYA